MRHPWSSQLFKEGARKAGRDPEVVAAAELAASQIKSANSDLPVIFTLGHLGHLADVSPTTLREIIVRQEEPYRVFRVKKRARPGRGAAAPRRYRTICVPNPALMRTQRWIAQNILNVVTPHEACFAFTPCRDLVGAAERHAECKWLVKVDVRHFFESITESQVYDVFRGLGYGALISFEMARLCTRLHSRDYRLEAKRPKDGQTHTPYRKGAEGHLPQGAPTSPMLANLVVRRLDERLSYLAQTRGWIYARYADDLSFSTKKRSTRGQAMGLATLVESELARFGLKANRQKTSISPPGARKVLLGVLVDRETPRLTREFRNNIETHLYALTNPKIGVAAHRLKRGFASTIGMRRHVAGLIAFAHQVDEGYAQGLYETFNQINWDA